MSGHHFKNSVTVPEAVVLMAGSGSRLRERSFKPLLPLLGRPLISHTFEALANAGIQRVHAVVGYESESLIAQMQPWILPELDVQFINNPKWQKQNGISVLAAAAHVTSPFLLIMSDHLFDQS